MTNKENIHQYESSRLKRNKRVVKYNRKLFSFKSVISFLISWFIIYFNDSYVSEDEHQQNQTRVPVLVDVIQENEEKDKRIGMFVYIYMHIYLVNQSLPVVFKLILYNYNRCITGSSRWAKGSFKNNYKRKTKSNRPKG